MGEHAAGERHPGVSIVVCCHNSASRLPPTLAHLAAQQVRAELPWEVLVVDNASTDETARVAQSAWPVEHAAPLRIVPEPRAGLSFARQRGFDESRYDIVSFIDDDNWVCPEWVRLIAEVMDEHPEVGACGGLNEAVCEVTPPEWFERHQRAYAVGAQATAGGIIPGPWAWLCGAGMSLRRGAWCDLQANGFRHLLSGRQGKRLTSGEDLELSYALHMAGWELWYEPRLRLQHFLPAGRLQWSYLRRLQHGGGAASVGLDPYGFFAYRNMAGRKERLRRSWQWQALSTLKALLPYRQKLLRSYRSPMEGDADVLRIEHLTGRLSALIQSRRVYRQQIDAVLNASWISPSSPSFSPAVLAPGT